MTTPTDLQDFQRLDAVAQAELVRSGAASPLELVEASIKCIEKANPVVNAVVWDRFEAAREEARQLRSGAPFAGVPLLIKDLGCPVEGCPDTQGSLVLKQQGSTADHDSAIVRRFKGAGFILLGGTNTPEFGLSSDAYNDAYGATLNPWNPAHSAGGSSGGAGAAVAAGMVAVAHGNDGGGSIRIPAAHCGVVGLKPTRGRVSHAPDAGDPMFGHVTSGVLTRTVRDTAQILDVLAGYEPGDPSTPSGPPGGFAQSLQRDPGALRIGFVDRPGGVKWAAHPDCTSAVATAAQVLQDLNHHVEADHPAALFEAEFWDRWFDALSPTVSDMVDRAQGTEDRTASFDPVTQLWAARGRQLSAQNLSSTLDWLDGYRRRLVSWWAEGFDLLLSPVFPTPAPRSGNIWSYPEGVADSVDILQFTPQFNSSGQPAIAVPMAWNDENLPVGVQLIAAPGREDLLIQVAAQIEQARPWAHQYPAGPTNPR